MAALALLRSVLLFTRTQYGLLARAASQNLEMAQALGAAARKINLATFVLGCALASLGGALLAPLVSVSPSLGQAFIGQAFMTVVIAGPAFITGMLLTAVLLGGISNLLSQALTTLWGTHRAICGGDSYLAVSASWHLRHHGSEPMTVGDREIPVRIPPECGRSAAMGRRDRSWAGTCSIAAIMAIAQRHYASNTLALKLTLWISFGLCALSLDFVLGTGRNIQLRAERFVRSRRIRLRRRRI